MSDKNTKASVSPELTARYQETGEELATLAENGQLTEVMSELNKARDACWGKGGNSEYEAIIKSMEISNKQHISDAEKSNQQPWYKKLDSDHKFGFGDKVLPTLIFTDTDKNGLPDRLDGSILVSGPKEKPQETKPTESQEAAKPTKLVRDGETILMNPYSDEQVARYLGYGPQDTAPKKK